MESIRQQAAHLSTRHESSGWIKRTYVS